MELVKKGFVPQGPVVNIPSWVEKMMDKNGIRDLSEFPAALKRDPLMTGLTMERLEELVDILKSGKVDGYSRVEEVIKRYYDPSAHFVPRISEEAKVGLARLGIDEKRLNKYSVNDVFPHTFFFGIRGMEVLPFQWAAAMLPGRFSTDNKNNLFKYVEGDMKNLKDILPTMRTDEQTVMRGFNKNGEFRMDMFHLKLAIGRGREACLRAFDNAIISLLHPVRKKVFRDGIGSLTQEESFWFDLVRADKWGKWADSRWKESFCDRVLEAGFTRLEDIARMSFPLARAKLKPSCATAVGLLLKGYGMAYAIDVPLFNGKKTGITAQEYLGWERDVITDELLAGKVVRRASRAFAGTTLFNLVKGKLYSARVPGYKVLGLVDRFVFDSSNVLAPECMVVSTKEEKPVFVAETITKERGFTAMTVKKNMYEKAGIAQCMMLIPSGGLIEVFDLGKDGRYGAPQIFSFNDDIVVRITQGLDIIVNMALEKATIRSIGVISPDPPEKMPKIDKDILLGNIRTLPLSTRAMNAALNSTWTHCIGELVCRTEEEIREQINVGGGTVKEIRAALKNMGLDLGMDGRNIPNYPTEEEMCAVVNVYREREGNSGSDIVGPG